MTRPPYVFRSRNVDLVSVEQPFMFHYKIEFNFRGYIIIIIIFIILLNLLIFIVAKNVGTSHIDHVKL